MAWPTTSNRHRGNTALARTVCVYVGWPCCTYWQWDTLRPLETVFELRTARAMCAATTGSYWLFQWRNIACGTRATLPDCCVSMFLPEVTAGAGTVGKLSGGRGTSDLWLLRGGGGHWTDSFSQSAWGLLQSGGDGVPMTVEYAVSRNRSRMLGFSAPFWQLSFCESP